MVIVTEIEKKNDTFSPRYKTFYKFSVPFDRKLLSE